MHIDHEDLALVAIGEGDQEHRDHLSGCAQCREEVDSLAAVTQIMADGGPVPIAAPDYLWPSIEAAIESSTRAEAERKRRSDGAGTSAGATVISDVAAVPTSMESRREKRRFATQGPRRFSGVSLLGAAAAGAAVMFIGSAVIGADDSNDGPVLATANLAALEEFVTPGTAEIIEQDGQRVLREDASDLPSVEDGYLQVWLLQDDASGMVALGSLSQSGEEFELPEGLSTDTFTTVDVSVEHYDGNPAHSGESLWRGPLSST